jgi:hypothetical protein
MVTIGEKPLTRGGQHVTKSIADSEAEAKYADIEVR